MPKRPIFFTLLLSLFLSASAQQDEFVYIGFSGDADGGGSNMSLNGVAEIENSGILRLTNETSRLIGHAFYPAALRFRNATTGVAFSFSTTFAFAIVPEYTKLGGHGLAFTIAPTKEIPGALPSQYLGLMNASDVRNATNHVFAVEFDTVQDFEFDDVNDNHVGVDINSLVSNPTASAAYYGDDGVKKDLNLKGGYTIQAWVDYDGAEKVLNVTISPFSTKPSTPLLSFQVDLSPVLLDDMFVGFSASTGLLASTHYLFGWSFKMKGACRSLELSSLPSLPQSKKKNVTLTAAISVTTFVLLIAAAAATTAYLFYWIKNADVIEAWELTCGPHRFSYEELKRATKGFRDQQLLGFGGFGKVYKGTLPGSRVEVAVKRVSHESRQGIREFVAEIASVGRLRHRNLVQLRGWCRRRGDLFLVYDYMPNGSLDKFLFRDDSLGQRPRPVLSWPQRFRIVRGVASALLYLHEEWEHVVIHRDVKASNVLLDAEFNPRLGDFGLAKLHDHGANPSTTRAVGTLGYLAPELTRTGKATTSSDVYAFGALVLEVVCGRRPVEPKALPEELVLVDWVWERWTAGRWADVVDHRLGDDYDREEAVVAIKVGLWCSHPSAAARPGTREVVRYLDGGDAAEVPPLAGPPEEYDAGESNGGFDDLVHSYLTSSEKISKGSAALGQEASPTCV